MKVSLNEAKIWATPKTISPSLTEGPNVTFSSFGSLVFLLDCNFYPEKHKSIIKNYSEQLKVSGHKRIYLKLFSFWLKH